LIGWDALLVLNLLLHILDAVGGFDVEGDGLARQGLNEDLHRHEGRQVWGEWDDNSA